MVWVHGFGMYGMGGPNTNPGEEVFTADVKAAIPGINVHGSPYRDYQAGDIAAEIDRLPPEALVFVWGTSLGANDCPVVATYTHHVVHGLFGFQASMYGVKWPVPKNVRFAHLIYSYNPIPFPLLGAYKWVAGDGFDPKSLHLTAHHIPHPGDYDVGDRQMFLAEMKRIVAAASA